MPPSHQRLATTRDNRPSPTVSVVIPALNEETNLPLVLEGLPPVDEVVIVDGGSADDTVAIAREVRPDAVVVRQTRHGKGNALVCGFAAASGDIVVTLNADGSTDPGELSRFVDALISGAEVAHGSRFRDGGSDLGGQRLDRLGNAILSRFVNALFGTRFTDVEYGYNAYWRALLPALNLPGADIPGLRRGGHVWGDGSEIEPLLNIRVAAQGMRVVEVSSIGYPPINGVRHHEGWERALRATRVAFGEYLRHRRQSRRPVPAPATARLRSRPALPAAGRVDTGSMHVRDLALGQGQTHPGAIPDPTAVPTPSATPNRRRAPGRWRWHRPARSTPASTAPPTTPGVPASSATPAGTAPSTTTALSTLSTTTAPSTTRAGPVPRPTAAAEATRPPTSTAAATPWRTPGADTATCRTTPVADTVPPDGTAATGGAPPPARTATAAGGRRSVRRRSWLRPRRGRTGGSPPTPGSGGI